MSISKRLTAAAAAVAMFAAVAPTMAVAQEITPIPSGGATTNSPNMFVLCDYNLRFQLYWYGVWYATRTDYSWSMASYYGQQASFTCNF